MGTRYQLFPKLIHGPAAVTHSPQKLKDMFHSIWYKLLPSHCVNRNITKEYRRLPLHYQGLALPNLNIGALSNKIHLLQVHWATGSTSGRMLHQAYQVFQVEAGLGGNIFSQSFEAFWSTCHTWILQKPMGTVTSIWSCILPTSIFCYCGNMIAC